MIRRLLIALAAIGTIAAIGPATAAVSNNPVYVQTPNRSSTTFVQGTDAAGTYKTIYTGGANGSKIKGVFVTSNDGSASHLVTVQISTSSSAHCSPQSNCLGGAAVTVASNSGFANATAAVNFMSATVWPGLPLDSDGNTYFYLKSGDTLEATYATALTSSTQLAVTVIGEDF